MNKMLTHKQRNSVLNSMASLIADERQHILAVNKTDVDNYKGDDLAMYDRLKVDESKVDGMILALQQLIADEDPLGKELYSFNHENGMKIINGTAPFGTVLIIYAKIQLNLYSVSGILILSAMRVILSGKAMM